MKLKVMMIENTSLTLLRRTIKQHIQTQKSLSLKRFYFFFFVFIIPISFFPVGFTLLVTYFYFYGWYYMHYLPALPSVAVKEQCERFYISFANFLLIYISSLFSIPKFVCFFGLFFQNDKSRKFGSLASSHSLLSFQMTCFFCFAISHHLPFDTLFVQLG